MTDRKGDQHRHWATIWSYDAQAHRSKDLYHTGIYHDTPNDAGDGSSRICRLGEFRAGRAQLIRIQVSSSSASDSTSLPWLMPNGETTNSTVKMLDGEGLVPYPTEAVPPSSREIRLEVNQSNPEVWVMESGQPFDANNGQTTPLLFSPRNASGVFWLNKGDVVDVLLQVCCSPQCLMSLLMTADLLRQSGHHAASDPFARPLLPGSR